MKYWIKRSVLPFGIVCLMSMALCGCGRGKNGTARTGYRKR